MHQELLLSQGARLHYSEVNSQWYLAQCVAFLEHMYNEMKGNDVRSCLTLHWTW